MSPYPVFGAKRRFAKQIDEYSRRLGSSEKVNRDEVARCHTLKLVLEKEDEKRLRSIQTLAQISQHTGIGPAINDLIATCRKWPRQRVVELSWFLAAALKDFLREPDDGASGSAEQEVSHRSEDY
jgi:hypothetical protein